MKPEKVTRIVEGEAGGENPIFPTSKENSMNFITRVRSIIFGQLMGSLHTIPSGDLVPKVQRRNRCHFLSFLAPQRPAPPGAG